MSVRNALVLFLALSTLALLVACGSSSPRPQPPPGGGFSATNFKGTYVFSFSGFLGDTNAAAGTQSSLAMVGTLSADGGGNITGGTVDLIDPDLGSPFVFPGLTLSASKYTVSQDGRGNGSLITPQGTFGIDFVLTSNGQGLITRFDRSGTGSGTLDLQSTATQSSLGSLSFTLSGADGTDAVPLGSVGGFALNSSTGAITSGTQDFNEGGTSATANPLSGSVVLTSGTAGTATLDTSVFNSLAFDVFVIDSTHLKFIETDGVELLSGDAFTQQTSIPVGTLAFTLAGFDSSSQPFAAGGLLAVGANGSLSGIEDFNDSGTINTSPNIAGTCTLSAGRCQVALTNFNNTLLAYQFAVYPSSGGILLLEVDNLGITQGAAYVQSSTALSAPQGYGLNLTGYDLTLVSEVDDIAEFTAQSVGSNGSGSLTGIVDINDAGTAGGQGLGSSTYTPDSPATGRGSITTNAFALEYYTVDGSNVIFIESDATQVSAGTFQLQSASSSPGAAQPAAAQSVRSAFRPMAPPMLRAHSALRRK